MKENFLHDKIRKLTDESETLKAEVERLDQAFSSFKNNIVETIRESTEIITKADKREIDELFFRAWRVTFEKKALEQYTELHSQIKKEMSLVSAGFKTLANSLIKELVLSRKDNSLIVSMLIEKNLLSALELKHFDKSFELRVDEVTKQLREEFYPCMFKGKDAETRLLKETPGERER